jgi:hypothetical protein
MQFPHRRGRPAQAKAHQGVQTQAQAALIVAKDLDGLRDTDLPGVGTDRQRLLDNH